MTELWYCNQSMTVSFVKAKVLSTADGNFCSKIFWGKRENVIDLLTFFNNSLLKL